MKKRIYFLALLLIAMPALAIECEVHSPCTILETCQDGDCGDCSIKIYSPEGNLSLFVNMSKESEFIYSANYTGTNITGFYPYTVSCTTNQTCVGECFVEVRESKMWLLGVLILPALVAFLFLYFGGTLDDSPANEALRWFMRLLALLMLFPLYLAANVIISLNPGYNALLTIFDLAAFTWIFFTVMAILLLYLLYKVLAGIKIYQQEKRKI